ncbi:matrixin family metalloprotease [Candidatus Obscuribacterales bacterium]|nr:matrixin family metalloprotease [Candidatus Obscuribacterales bacterium]
MGSMALNLTRALALMFAANILFPGVSTASGSTTVCGAPKIASTKTVGQKKSGSGSVLSGANQQLFLDAKSLYESGRYWGALTKLEKIIETDRDDPAVYLYLGHAYSKARKVKEAARAYDTYLQLEPDAPDAEKYRTLVNVLQGQQRNEPRPVSGAGTASGDYMKETTATGLFRWPDSRMPIKVYIEPATAVPGYRPEFDDVLQHAFREWTTATDGKVKFEIVTNRDGAEMVVSWTDDMHAPELQAEAGKASIVQDSEGIKSAEIQLLTVSPFKDGPVGCELLYNICLHEIGHGLGLMGHSPYPEDIMYPQLSVQTGITPRDARTFQVVYAAAAEALKGGSGSSSPEETADFDRLSPANKAQLFLKAGTRAVFAGQYRESISKLEDALRINPDLELAKSNLAVAANNLALQTKDEKERVNLLHKAIFWNPGMEAGRQNLNSIVETLGTNPTDPAARVLFANKLEKENDLLGACVELLEAERLKPDTARATRAAQLRQKVLSSI